MEPALITLDTSALLALFDGRDPAHVDVRAVLADDRGPYRVPAAILAEVSYFVGRRFGQSKLALFLDDLVTGAWTYDCGDTDLRRVRDLVGRYTDLPLGAPDAAVVACAERNGGRVLTVDRDFAVVAGEGTITVLP
jgi:predicted nucleic acid-binding protein